jgi:hypothetical protein
MAGFPTSRAGSAPGASKYAICSPAGPLSSPRFATTEGELARDDPSRPRSGMGSFSERSAAAQGRRSDLQTEGLVVLRTEPRASVGGEHRRSIQGVAPRVSVLREESSGTILRRQVPWSRDRMGSHAESRRDAEGRLLRVALSGPMALRAEHGTPVGGGRERTRSRKRLPVLRGEASVVTASARFRASSLTEDREVPSAFRSQ